IPPSGSTSSATASAAGQDVVLQTVPAASAGIYTITVGGVGTTTGGYTVQVILNAAQETEGHGGATNNTLATAQNIDASFISLGPSASRGAVLGTTDTGVQTVSVSDFESGAQGYTINNNIAGRGTGLWHLSTRRSTQSGHSPFTSFYYGREDTGTYDTGVANAGTITSSAITLPTGAVTLSFNYVLQTEGNGGFDVASVQVSNNGGASFTTVASSTSSAQ